MNVLPQARRTLARALGLTCAATLLVSGTVASAATPSQVWSANLTYGYADRSIDGDTVAVRVDGDSSTVGLQNVRNIGIQAMETGSCHAAEATAAMGSLVAGKRVRLSAASATMSSLGRPVRYVDVLAGSTWVDTQTRQLQQGHAIPVMTAADSSRWKAHFIAAQQARRAAIGLWDADFCGSGPAQSNPLRVWVNWDGNGNESLNPNLEYVRVLNSGATTLAVGGWWIRTGGQDTYRLPTSARIPARGTLTLRVGKGTSTATTFYWGSSTPKFPNANPATNSYGSGAYLFDPQGDLRAGSIYPCLVACTDALIGKVAMAVTADAAGDDSLNVNGESVRLTGTGTSTVDISYTVLASNGYVYEFPAGSYIRPGERLTVRSGKGTSTRLNRYWGSSSPVLPNAGGSAQLRTPESVRIVCRSWSTGRC